MLVDLQHMHFVCYNIAHNYNLLCNIFFLKNVNKNNN